MATTVAELEALLQIRDTASATAKQALGNIKEAVVQAQQSLKALNLDALTDSSRKLGSGATEAARGMGAASTNARQLGDEGRKAGQGMSSLGESLSKVSSSLKTIGLSATAGLTVPLGLATKSAVDFQRETLKLTTIAGESATAIGGIRQQVLDLAPAVGKGPAELAKAMLVVESTGLTGAKAMDVLTRSAKLGTIGLGETNDIARTLTGALNSYAKSGLTAAQASDQLLAAVREGGAEATEMAGALGRVTGIAAQAGVSFAEVGASIATFTRLGISAEEATTAVRGTLLNLIAPGKEASDALAGLGLSVQDVQKALKERGLAQVLQELIEKTHGNVEALDKLFPNVRALAGVLGTAGAQGEQYKEVLERIRNATGDMDKAFQSTQKTTGFTFDQLVAKVQVLAIQFANNLTPALDRLLPTFQRVLDHIGHLIEKFSQLPAGVQDFSIGLVGLVAAAGPIALAIGGVGSLIEKLILLRTTLSGISLAGSLGSIGSAVGGGAAAGAAGGLPGIAIGAGTALVATAGALAIGHLRDQADAAGKAMVATRGATESLNLNKAVTLEQAKAAAVAAEQSGLLSGKSTELKVTIAALGTTQQALTSHVVKTAEELKEEAKAAEKAREQMREFIKTTNQAINLDAIRSARKEWDGVADALNRAFAAGAGLAGVVPVITGLPNLKGIGTPVSGASLFNLPAILAGTAQTPGSVFAGSPTGLPVTSGLGDINSLIPKSAVNLLGTTNPLTPIFDGMDEIARQTAQLAQISGGQLSSTAKSLGEFAASMSLAGHAGSLLQSGRLGIQSSFTSGQGGGFDAGAFAGAATNLAIGGIEAVGAFQQATQAKSTGARIAGSAATGAKIGTAILPGWGTAIGAGVGALIGAIKGAPEYVKAQKDIAKTLGVDVPDELAKKIAEGVKKFGTTGAKVANLGDIIAAGGGANEQNVNTFTRQLRDAFSLIEQGKFTTKDAAKAIDSSFGQLANVYTSKGKIISEQLREIIALNEKFGTGSKAVADFVVQQTRSGLGGLGSFLTSGQAASKAISDLQAQRSSVAEQRKQFVDPKTGAFRPDSDLSDSERKQIADLDKQWDDLTKKIAEATKVKQGFTISSEASGQGFAAALSASFATLQKQGTPLAELIKEFGPAVAALDSQLQAAGFDGGEAFKSIAETVALANDTIAGPLLSGIIDVGNGIQGLYNSGVLTQDAFKGLAEQVGATYKSLVDQGKGGEAALRAIQPQLQTIWEISKKWGLTLDDNTQALLDGAEASGIIGKDFVSNADKMVAGIDTLNENFKTFLEYIGAIPKTAADAARGIQSEFDKVHIQVPVDFKVNTPDVPGFIGGSGGVRNFGSGTLAVLHGEEGVFTKNQINAILKGGAGQSSRQTIEVPVYLDGREVARATAPHLPKTILERR